MTIRGLARRMLLSVGLGILVKLARRHGLFEREKLAAFLRSGRLA